MSRRLSGFGVEDDPHPGPLPTGEGVLARDFVAARSAYRAALCDAMRSEAEGGGANVEAAAKPVPEQEFAGNEA